MTTRPTIAYPSSDGEPMADAVDDLTIVYPSSDGEPMAENDYQFTALTETALTLRQWLAHRPDVYVGGDMLIYYQMNDNQTRIAPDLFVVFGVTDQTPRYSWLIWREGQAPDFVLEIASPGTWQRDAGRKRQIYADLGVTEYWRFDPTGECFTPPLIGERLIHGQYRPIPLQTDPHGILRGPSQTLSLEICAHPAPDRNHLRLYDPKTHQWLRTHHEQTQAHQATEAARQATEAVLGITEAALAAEQSARQATATTLGLTEAALATTEAALAAEQSARQTTEAALAAEQSARQAAEAEMRRLQERLRQLESG